MKNEILKIWSSSRPFNIKENTSLESFTNILKALFGLCNTIIFKIVQHLKYNQKVDRKVRRHNNLRKNYCVLYRMVHKYWLKISVQKVKWFSIFKIYIDFHFAGIKFTEHHFFFYDVRWRKTTEGKPIILVIGNASRFRELVYWPFGCAIFN